MSAFALTALAFTLLGLFWVFLNMVFNVIEKAARAWREDSSPDGQTGA